MEVQYGIQRYGGIWTFRVRPEKLCREEEGNDLAKEDVYYNGLICPLLEKGKNNLRTIKRTTKKTEGLKLSISVTGKKLDEQNTR